MEPADPAPTQRDPGKACRDEGPWGIFQVDGARRVGHLEAGRARVAKFNKGNNKSIDKGKIVNFDRGLSCESVKSRVNM